MRLETSRQGLYAALLQVLRALQVGAGQVYVAGRVF